MVGTINHHVGGTLVEGKSGRFGDVYNPATGEVAAKVSFASAAEVGEAIRRGPGGAAGLGFDPAGAAPPG